jgi:hypothetical protein
VNLSNSNFLIKFIHIYRADFILGKIPEDKMESIRQLAAIWNDLSENHSGKLLFCFLHILHPEIPMTTNVFF